VDKFIAIKLDATTIERKMNYNSTL